MLEKSGGELSYADLFVRCRAAVRSRAFDQDPQFEAYDRFDAGAGFLGRPMARTSRGRYLVSCDQGAWIVGCGAINGVATEPEITVALALYSEADETTSVGTARVVQVGPHKSEIELDFDSTESARYVAEITSLPAAPMPVTFAGDEQTRAAIEEALKQHGVHVSVGGERDAARYALTAREGRLSLTSVARDVEIGFADAAGSTHPRAAAALAPALKHVVQWERTLKLQNPRTAMDRSKVELAFVEQMDGGSERLYDGGEATFTFTRVNGQWRQIRGRFKVRNRTEQTVFTVLAYFSELYGIYILPTDPSRRATTG